MEADVKPTLPTSGQMIGALVKRSGVKDQRLASRTARRYFSGEIDKIVKNSSMTEIVDAVSELLATTGIIPKRVADAQSLPEAIFRQAHYWDEFRAFMHNRTLPVQPDNLRYVWEPYARLIAIDLSIRTAAYLHLSEAAIPSELDWVETAARGERLKRLLRDGRLTRDGLAESAEVSRNAVDAWLDRGIRPSDENIEKIAVALARDGGEPRKSDLRAELRRFYWFSEIAELTADLVGQETMIDLVQQICKYAAWTRQMLDEIEVRMAQGETSAKAMDDSQLRFTLTRLLYNGTATEISEPLLETLADEETDSEWKQALQDVSHDWVTTPLRTNIRVNDSEVASSNQSTDGGLLESWGISSKEAYAHYEKSWDLAAQRRYPEALAEVRETIRLDPTDWGARSTLGSRLGTVGARDGDAEKMEEGLSELWISARGDTAQLIPWTEIGWVLLEAKRFQEAIDHLLAVSKERYPLDANYYRALGCAYRGAGRAKEALESFEEACRLDKENLNYAIAALDIALLLDLRGKARKYEKIARHLGASGEMLSLMRKAADSRRVAKRRRKR